VLIEMGIKTKAIDIEIQPIITRERYILQV